MAGVGEESWEQEARMAGAKSRELAEACQANQLECVAARQSAWAAVLMRCRLGDW